MASEQTYIMIKPDGVQRGLVAAILGRFETRGFQIVGMKMLTPTKELASSHYGEHEGKPFFGGLVDFLSSGPVVGVVLQGKGVVAAARMMLGATKPLESAPGTIRGDFAIDMGRNVMHASDSVDSATREIGLWFKKEEVVSWTSCAAGSLLE
ncbi:hypothetical protein I4F81_012741 [Pyropia yezoensis]|uniref:Uncharacterized protein n=1 Tax=Pyropia yezoensis TaxID=2788 RepID=A0ACC3CK54_PYRYE|nr:hypothetical protein I4F81_012741 [Neopyropia yezoensis]